MAILPYVQAVDKWQYFKEKSVKTSKKLQILIKTNQFAAERVYRMEHCSDHIEYEYCPECGSLHIARTWLCRDRMCPLCSWRLALKRTAEMMRVLDYLHDDKDATGKVAMLTLTIRNCKGEALAETVDKMLSAWTTMKKRRIIAKTVNGYARSLELTQGTEGTWHPHIHAIIWYAPNEKPISQHEWCDLWREALNIDYTPICDIRAAYARNNSTEDEWSKMLAASVEAIKYAIKPSVTDDASADDLSCINAALASKMLISYGGIIRKARRAMKINDSDRADQVTDTAISCPKCDNAGTIRLVYEWQMGQYMLAKYQ